MRSITLPQTDLSVSRFVFGTSGLFNVRGRENREALLEEAVAQGFSHFDTAPYYGFGHAERDLAPILAQHPDVTVATKVGLYSPGGEAQPAWQVFARKAVGRAAKSMSKPELDFSLDRAQQSLVGSLRRLGRERIDLYLLHEPELALIATEEWLRWLEDCRTSGKVRYFGMAGLPESTVPILAAEPGLGMVLQLADSLDRQEADHALGERAMQVTYGYVSAAMQRARALNVPGVLAKALERNRTGAVIVSTTRRERLAQYAPIAGAAG
ncbi:aldo/keto reductase family protein [Parerythrobacter aestuarii]|uniref:aldo/keto reductase family protein n=1 Tax=Parerythrobacter aestuarii TaxID=3020909 RepID=UPI0024DE93AB|nr:aldo/keto reductase [Parerythrobacter aestuarii]